MDVKALIGAGKTFTGAIIAIACGGAAALGLLPPGVHVDASPVTLISGGLVALGLGYKLEKLIAVVKATGMAPTIVGELMQIGSTVAAPSAPSSGATLKSHWLVGALTIGFVAAMMLPLAACNDQQINAAANVACAGAETYEQGRDGLGAAVTHAACANPAATVAAANVVRVGVKNALKPKD